ncbi:MAG: hypothetical protein Kow0020_07200 [Wenzhouxiangellaceae bacterium]
MSRIALLRTRSRADWRWATEGADTVFLHGDAVNLVAAPVSDGAEVVVCSSAWRRRHAQPPAPPVAERSLMWLMDRLCAATYRRVAGRGGRVAQSRQDDGEQWLIEITDAPVGALDRRETLEFVLAAASFGLNARVLFHRNGYNHLLGPEARAWRQLVDYDLLPLTACFPAGVAIEWPVQRISAVELEALTGAPVPRLPL